MDFQAQWRELNRRHAAITKREKGLLLGTACIATFFILNIIWFGHKTQKLDQYEKNLSTQQKTLAELQGQITGLKNRQQIDPNAELNSSVEKLRKELQEIEGKLSLLDVIPPEKTQEVLYGLLGKTTGVRILSLRTLPPEGIKPPAMAKISEAKPAAPTGMLGMSGMEGMAGMSGMSGMGAAPPPNPPTAPGVAPPNPSATATTGSPAQAEAELPPFMYKHGFEVKLEGNYLDLMRYVKGVEEQPRHFLWHRAQLAIDETSKKPILTLWLYTLSTRVEWMAL